MHLIFKLLKHVQRLSILLLLVNPVKAELISIDNFLQTYMQIKSVNKLFTSELKDGFYSTTYSKRYLAITNFISKTVKTTDGTRDIKEPSKIDIFNSQRFLFTIPNDSKAHGLKWLLDDVNKFLAFYKKDDGRSGLGLYGMDGQLGKKLPVSFMVCASQTGKFYCGSTSNHLNGPVHVYDENGNYYFKISTKRDYQIEAATDSTLIVLHYKSVALWDVKNKKMLWEKNIPRDDFITDMSGFKIMYSILADIIVVRDLIGLYCFDFQGNFQWSQEGFRGFKDINMLGVSEKDGMVAVSNTIDVNLYDRDGNLLVELDGDFSQDISMAGNWGHVMDVFPDYMLIRYLARTIEGDKLGKMHVTRIYYYNGNKWITGVVDGFWYLLDSDIPEKTLIGFDSVTNFISAYSVK